MARDASRRSAHVVRKREIGLKLKRGEKRKLAALTRRGKMTARACKRVRVLQLLAEGASYTRVAEVAGTSVSTVGFIKARYRERGLDGTLKDRSRAAKARALNARQEQQLVAVLCGPSPSGHARWTIRTAAEEAVKRKIVQKVGRETVRVLMKNHARKPWREKNVVRAEVDGRVRRKDGGRARSLREAAESA